LFAELLVATITFVISVRMHQLATNERIFVKFGRALLLNVEKL